MIKKITSSLMQENCYIISKNSKCIIIDPGANIDEIINYIKTNKLKAIAVLLTHGHFDHCMGCKILQDLGVKIYIHKYDADKLYTNNNLSYLLDIKFDQIKANVLFEEI